MMVSVGTHEQPFQRLLDAAAGAVRARPGDEWVVQYGVGSWTIADHRVRAASYLDADAMRETLEWADVLVSQASPGNVFGAHRAGAWPLVLGRTHAAGEHVDDHQVHFAAALVRLGHATDIQRPELLSSALDLEALRSRAERRRRTGAAMRSARDAERAFRDDVWSVLGTLT